MHSPAPPSASAAPVRQIAYAQAAVVRTLLPDGAVLLRAPAPLQAYEPSLAQMFRAAHAAAPARVFLAERGPTADGWRKLTYAQARPIVDALAQALIERGLGAERPVMILSGNAIDHALLMLAGYTAGIPVAPVSRILENAFRASVSGLTVFASEQGLTNRHAMPVPLFLGYVLDISRGRLAPVPVLFCHAHHQSLNPSGGPRSPRCTTGSPVVFLGDQFSNTKPARSPV